MQLGFPSLIRIQHGFVRIEKNPMLCYANTIDWEAITDERDSVDNGNVLGNYIRNGELVECPTTAVCRGCEPRFCWNNFSCQKFETGLNAFGELKD